MNKNKLYHQVLDTFLVYGALILVGTFLKFGLRCAVNKLSLEKSPYLKQHAENPVDWYPWGPEAFAKAKSENKPIFLSIGYSTCHWCHVMAHESFEDQGVADILNKNFVSIKVDREERPDIDSIYMTVCQMMTGHGGWPLTIFMSPEQKPFFAGTYFPKESKYGRAGIKDLLINISELWKNKKQEIQTTIKGVQDALAQLQQSRTGGVSQEGVNLQNFVNKTREELFELFDPDFGGFGSRPKFPSPQKIIFLLEDYKISKNIKSLEIAEKTLFEMHRGGFYDHLAGGFHRYSTDEKWELPHFEKMLYDQAWLSYAYTFAYELTQKTFYKKIAENIFEFIQNEMTHEQGGVYSAFDADSEGEEGKFYIWKLEELKELLSEADAQFLGENFHLDHDGNFLDEATQEKTGQNILFLKESLQNKSSEEVDVYFERLVPIQTELLKVRSQREKPLRDEKILTDWNSQIAASLFYAARIFKSQKLQKQGLRVLNFIIENLKLNNHLFHRICDDELQKFEFLDDQASFIWSLVHAFELTKDPKHLKMVSEHLDKIFLEYEDANGGFFLTPKSQEVVLQRTKDIYDGAAPSASAIMMINLAKVSMYKNAPELQAKYEKHIKFLYPSLMDSPSAHAFWAYTCLFFLHPYCEEGLC